MRQRDPEDSVEERAIMEFLRFSGGFLRRSIDYLESLAPVPCEIEWDALVLSDDNDRLPVRRRW